MVKEWKEICKKLTGKVCVLYDHPDYLTFWKRQIYGDS